MTSPLRKHPEKYKDEFYEEIVRSNFFRSRNLALVLFFLNIFFFLSDLLNYKEGLWHIDVISGYMVLFCFHVILGVFSLVFLILSWVHRLKSEDQKITRWHAFLGTLFSCFIIFTSSCISINDQLLHSQITAFILGSIIIAVNNYMKPIMSITIYAVSWIVFMVGITLLQSNLDVLKGNYLNGILLIVFVWFLSYTLYNMKIQDFINQKTIEQKNREVEEYNNELIEINYRLKESLQALDESQNVIFTLASALESKDTYTRGHSERVANYALQLAQILELSINEQQTVWRAAQLHDIGKIGIPDAILNKPGKLNNYEWEIMRSHPEMGENICSTLSFAKDFLPIIRHHHERFDGTGYPDGLRGEEIPFLARIITIADAIDAITSQRSYRPSRTIDYALEELAKGKGSQFDPTIAQVFIDSFNYA
ncbi:putative domain HDIG-containing protein [Desulfosporosinus orientis DSM 765]|uniref:Putative domain HDIG-containing protein n=1 Tax=Desulfosporosinus orientis (strain ATCC 19365 / DSM 765 / NCIMB 8382 / VKM B-1628 / Singapore I) TaxID=768706 RepID=G7WCA9_DESOD|nr:HD-GYP domain-containing protein [Desulfosporosinus orientis]AET70727.1 putative domain HDIG-containing protein [Desulfosporosinus orientis DSM 765]